MPRGIPQASSTCIGPADLPGQPGEGLCGRRPVVAHCLCGTHARRLQRKGTLNRVRAPRSKPSKAASDRTCEHPDGCDRPVYVHKVGLCTLHYTRIARGDDIGPAEPLRDPSLRGPCRHPDGCDRRGNGGDGWCPMHAERVKNHGDPGPVGPTVDRASHRQQRNREAAGAVRIDSLPWPSLAQQIWTTHETARERQTHG